MATKPKRCKTCYWWGFESNPSSTFRDCRLMSDWAYFTPEPESYRHFRSTDLILAMPWAGADGAGVATSEDFGCVEHTKTKPEDSEPT